MGASLPPKEANLFKLIVVSSPSPPLRLTLLNHRTSSCDTSIHLSVLSAFDALTVIALKPLYIVHVMFDFDQHCLISLSILSQTMVFGDNVKDFQIGLSLCLCFDCDTELRDLKL